MPMSEKMFIRSIPAYAGDPVHFRDNIKICAVYPRLRGGSAEPPTCGCGREGLSPPTRGIRKAGSMPVNHRRSIPAYAGDPAAGNEQDDDENGLSPPTRGILGRALAASQIHRSIPAYAGDPA